MHLGKKSRWFERNPKKTIFVILLFFVFLTMVAAEKLLAYKNRGIRNNYALANRAIRLREHRPLMADYFMYAKDHIKDLDGPADRKYLMRIDQNGFIMPSERHQHPDLSIFFLGGSSSECQYVDEENRFPYLAGVKLEKELGVKINSYNAARAGNNSMHSLDILLNKLLPMNPDIVVMMHNVNDLTVLYFKKTYWTKYSSRGVIFDANKEVNADIFRIWRDKFIPNLAREFRHLELAVKSRWRAGKKTPGGDPGEDEFAHIRGKILTFDKAAMVEQFEMNLQTFIHICQVRKVTPVLMTMANRLKVPPDETIKKVFYYRMKNITYEQYKDLFDSFNESIRKKARENNIMLIDLAREIPPERDYLVDIVHFNDRGAITAADIVSRELKPLVERRIKEKR